MNKNKPNILTVQQKFLESINKMESEIRKIRRKIQNGFYGKGNNFDAEKLAIDMNELADVEMEVEWIDERR